VSRQHDVPRASMLRANQSGHAYLSSNVTYRGENRERPRNFSTARALPSGAMKPFVPISVVFATAMVYSSAAAETSSGQQACIGDAFRVCSAAIPHRHEVYLCLLANRHQLSTGCRAAISDEPSHRLTKSTRARGAE